MVWGYLPTQTGRNAPPNSRLSSTVLRRIKVTFLDTVVRVEHSLGDEERVAVEVRVQR